MKFSNLIPFFRAILYRLVYPGIKAKYIHSNVFILNTRMIKIVKGSSIFQNVVINNYCDVSFGQECQIGPFVTIRSTNGALSVGDYFSINPFSLIDCNGQISIGRDVRIGAHSYIGPAHHEYRLFFKHPQVNTFEETPITISDTFIGNNVWIGTCVQIHPGSIIASNSIVGQSTSVRTNVEEATLIYNKSIRECSYISLD